MVNYVKRIFCHDSWHYTCWFKYKFLCRTSSASISIQKFNGANCSKRYTKQTIWGLFDVKMLLVVLVEHLFLVWHEKIIISIEKSTLQAFQHNWYRCANPLKLLISKPGRVSWFSPVYRYRFNIFCSVTKILQSLLYFDKFILFFTFIDPYPAFEILEVQQYRKLASISGVKKKDPI